MKVVAIVGGLGSQMFKYAFFYALKNKMSEEVLLDTTFYLQNHSWNGYELRELFNISEQCIEERLDEIQIQSLKNKKGNYIDVCLDFLNQFGPTAYYYMGKRVLLSKSNSRRNIALKLLINIKKKILMGEHILGRNYYYSVDDILNDVNAYYDEYAINSDDLFEEYKEELKRVFDFPEFDELNGNVANDMLKSNSVAIHVRRSDHLIDNNKLIQNGYYKRAVSFIKEKRNEKQVYYIFSEDINWCKNNLIELGLNHDDEIVFVDWNKKENSYRDMQLMTYCQHNVIPISSFSWWGYYLSKRSNKIVCAPKSYWTDVEYHF